MVNVFLDAESVKNLNPQVANFNRMRPLSKDQLYKNRLFSGFRWVASIHVIMLIANELLKFY